MTEVVEVVKVDGRGKNIKHFDLLEVNTAYLDSFRNSKYPEWNTNKKQSSSWAQYKVSFGKFLESIDKDAVTIDEDELMTFIVSFENEEVKKNRTVHVRTLLTHILTHNIENCRDHASKFVLVFTGSVAAWLVDDKELLARIEKM